MERGMPVTWHKSTRREYSLESLQQWAYSRYTVRLTKPPPIVSGPHDHVIFGVNNMQKEKTVGSSRISHHVIWPMAPFEKPTTYQ